MRFARGVLVAMVLLVAMPAHAYKFKITDDVSVLVGYLLQTQVQFTEDAAPNKTDWSKDFFLRRSRIMLGADITKWFSFFMETDQINLGKNGDWTTPFFVQDAFGTFKILDEFQIDFGMILLPFTRHSFSGATSLNGMDYHGKMIKYPDGSTKVFRDIGVQIRGLVADKKLQYRVGAFAGSQGVVLQKDAAGNGIKDKDGNLVGVSNPEDLPRVTGHVRYAILGVEPDFFPKGIYFGTEPLLSIGVGVDYVPKSVLKKAAVLGATGTPEEGTVTAKAEFADHVGVAGDVFLDWPIGEDHEVVFQGTYLYYYDGKDQKGTGMGGLFELGYRWWFLEPVFSADYFKSEGRTADPATGVLKPNSDYLALRGGLNFWIWKHQGSVKTEFAAEKTGDLSSAKFIKQFTLQGQVLF